MLVSLGRDNVGDQALVTRDILTSDHRRLRHLRVRGHDRLHLTRLDPETTDLHLLIRTTQILHLTAGIPPRDITRAIQTLARRKRRSHEPLRRQTRTP
ncbi:hypothetical protein, partial [Kitasatospora kifunensis]